MNQISGKTKVFGILGDPVSHSLSPAMHNAAFEHKRIDSVYVPFHTTKTGAFLKQALLSLGLSGVSVTIPHKTWAAKAADESDALTKLCGAANTLLAQNGRLQACNTDGPGAMRALEEKRTPSSRYLLIGYGGSALAIAHSILLKYPDAEITVTGRKIKKAAEFAKSVAAGHRRARTGARIFPDIDPDTVDTVIQTTPSGMLDGGSEVLAGMQFDPAWIRRRHTIFDIVYTPMKTPLLRLAEDRGARIVFGYKMLLYQAVLQFEMFTKTTAPHSLMERVLLDELRKRQK